MHQVIGAGAYGEVWLAENTLGTRRAVKVVWRAEFSSERPYEREFSGLLKFEPVSRSHEGFVDILQAGQGPGYFYYVMELADNAAAPGQPYRPRTLGAEARVTGQLPVADCVRYFLTLASALGSLHGAGLIHRDIKPSNIILVGGVAKLADIGLVAAADAERSFGGTEGFIPPEGPGTEAADIYSLGKVLYEVATGLDRLEFPSLPFDPATGRTAEDLLELNAILTKACAGDPRERYGSALEFHAELALLQSGRSVKRLRVLEERARWARQVVATAAVLALLATGGVLFAGYRARVAREHSEQLAEALARATLAEHRAESRLYDALAKSALAELRSGMVGRRFQSLETITSAAALRPGAPELRDAAITALAMPDLRLVREWALPAGFSRQCFSPDFQTIFLADTNGTILARSAGEGRDLYRFGKPGKPVAALDFQGPWLGVYRPGDNTSWWEVTTRRELINLPGCVASTIAPNGEWVVELDEAGQVRIHGLTPPSLRAVPGAVPITFLRAGADGNFLMGAKDNNFLEVRSLATGELRQRVELPEGEAVYVGYRSPDGRNLVAGTRGGRLLVWELPNAAASGKPPVLRANLPAHSTTLTMAAFHPDGDWCLTSSWDGTLRLSGLTEGRLCSLLRRSSGPAAFSADGTWFGGQTGEGYGLQQFAVTGRAICRVLGESAGNRGFRLGPWHADFLAGGRILATASHEGLSLYETGLGRQLAQWSRTNWFSICRAGDSNLYSAGPVGLSRWPLLWSADGRVLTVGREERVAEDYVFHMQASGDGQVLAAAGLRQFLCRFADRGLTHLVNEGAIRGVSLDRAGDRLAAVSLAQGLRIWDPATGEVLARLKTIGEGFAALRPDGARVVYNGPGAVVLFEVASGRECWRQPFDGLGGLATWSEDGALICVLREGMVPTLLEADTGRVLARLEHPEATTYNSVCFSPQADLLACVSTTHLVHLWNLRLLRAELARLNLDWKQPAYGPAPAEIPPPEVRLVESAP